MAKCPFAEQVPLSGSSGSYTGGPFKIVHHTTEGSSARGAFDAFRAHHSDPHFTVDENKIYQHIDTGVAARALRNAPGGVETNKDSAVQIEVVGFAHRPKSKATLRNVARLCRWIEQTHGVSAVWPNGPPKPAKNGQDPGGHNRDPRVWDSRSGHYGHSHVPENTHWDPAYTQQEAEFVISFDPNRTSDAEAAEFELLSNNPETDPHLSDDTSRMPDHDEVEPEGSPESVEAPQVSTEPADPALAAKIAVRAALEINPQDLQLNPNSLQESDAVAESIDAYPTGKFENLGNIRLRWVRPDWFEFIPRQSSPLRFVRSNGQVFEPRRMFTDGGSIPRIFCWGSDLDPWGFAPAFLLHDFEFDLHHCGRSNKSFEEVRDMMMEAVRTLMESGICPRSSIVFGMIHFGIDSVVARRLWNARPPACPLPPDSSE